MTAVGFIGLGRMGSQLARNLVKGGFSVVGFDIAPSQELAAAGISFAMSPAEVANRADIILNSLPDVNALEAVIAGRDGLFHRCNDRHIIADLGAYPLAAKIAAAQKMESRGAVFLDCQISGSPEMLVHRRGVIFSSGDSVAAERCGAVFDAVVDKRFFVGPFGNATRLKTANNLLVALNTWAAAEALAIAVRSGIDPHTAIAVMNSGAARSEMFAQRAPFMVERQYDSTSSTLGSFAVFLDLIEEALVDLKIDAPLASAVVGSYRRAIASGKGDLGMSSIYEMVNPSDGKLK